MKILMTKSWNSPEYLHDGLLHGLRSIFGSDVIDFPRCWYMYADSFGFGKRDLASITARGFTYYGRMDDYTVDRTDLEAKIRAEFFDYIIINAWYPCTLWNVILESTPRRKIIILDGRDETTILEPYIGCGRYFKRELTSNRGDVLPLSFGFPQERMSTPVAKTRALAPLIPGQLQTYIYNDEHSYYQQYNQSCFGITSRKQGWDCLRHYEIMGSQCLPWFLDIEQCPPRTGVTLPKQDLKLINNLIQQHGVDQLYGPMRPIYDDIASRVHAHFFRYCTTAAMATYVLDETRKS